MGHSLTHSQSRSTSRIYQKLLNMKVYVAILLALAIFLPLMCTVEAQSDADVETKDDETTTEEVSSDDASKDDAEKSDDDSSDDAAKEEGEKEIELEDMNLWKTMDLNKDGKLTIAEYERFSRSPGVKSFVRNMKEHKAVEKWAAEQGMDVEHAKAAIKVGAHAQRRHSYTNHARNSRIMAHRRRLAIHRRNQMIAQRRRQQRQNYFSKLGQQYYTAMRQRSGRHGEL